MINAENLKKIIINICDDLTGREEELCKLDSFVGDGDHGTTVKKAFTNIKDEISTAQVDSISDLFMLCATAVSKVTGGAIGPILASLFWGMSSSSEGKSQLGTSDLYDIFNGALKKVQLIGEAKVGDKTLVDSLSPAVDSLRESLDLSAKEAMKIAAEKAYEGALGTENIISKQGRSRFLNERSKGYIDAGSMSMYYFIKRFSDSL